jgi:thiol-disulfide isomerase/thioredoxin
MLSLCTAATLLVVGAGTPAGNDIALLDFTASWCGPCQRMAPVIGQLEASGMPVRKVDFDTQRALVQQYRVTGVPTFVMLVNGREVDRVVGATTYEHLSGMFTKAGATAGRLPAATNTDLAARGQVRGQSPDATRLPSAGVEMAAPPTFAEPANAPATNASSLDASPRILPASQANSAPTAASSAAAATTDLANRLVQSTVRLRVQDANGFGNGSGTIIDTHDDEALVLTCGHIVRDSQGKGAILVDVFAGRGATGVPGQLIRYDLETDVAVISFKPGVAVTAIPIAATGTNVARGDRVLSVGCDHGDAPAARPTQITSTRKFLGPDHVMAAGEPAQGRSGGGLFNERGELIGVCNAADPEDREGMYAALSTIHTLLDKANLSFVYQGGEPGAASNETASAIGSHGQTPPPMPRETPIEPKSNERFPVVQAGGPSSLAAASENADAAEVVCVVRDLKDPQAKSKVVVLDRVSPQFLAQIERESATQLARRPTSLKTTVDVGKKDTWQPKWREAKK